MKEKVKRTIIGIVLIVAMLMSLVVPVKAEMGPGPGPGIDIGKDLSKLPTQYAPAITFESVGLKGKYLTASKTTMGLSLKKYNNPETQVFFIWPVDGKPGYYTIAMITEYGNWLYINHPAKGKYPNIIPSRFNNGSYILPDTAYWKLQWRSVRMGSGSETGWTLINYVTKWVFATDGRGAFRIRVLNNSEA